MSEIQVTRLQQTIEKEILNFIQTNGLSKGDRLPSQEELALKLKVSRAALREALARLVNQGVVRQVHGIGTFVDQNPFIVQSSAEINLSVTEMILSLGMQPDTSEVRVYSRASP